MSVDYRMAGRAFVKKIPFNRALRFILDWNIRTEDIETGDLLIKWDKDTDTFRVYRLEAELTMEDAEQVEHNLLEDE